MKVFMKAGAEPSSQSSPFELICKSSSLPTRSQFVPTLCYSDAPVTLNFLWGCLIWSAQSIPLKDAGETPSMWSHLKYVRFCKFVSTVFVPLRSLHMLCVMYICSAGCQSSSFKQSCFFRTKSWHSAAGLQAALCFCVCVFLTQCLLLCVSLCLTVHLPVPVDV